jgi:TIGR03009 family protein
MRCACHSLAVLLVAAPVAFSQPLVGNSGTAPGSVPNQPAQSQPAPAQLPQSLVNHLNAWEAKQKQVNSLRADCELVRSDKIRRREKVYAGTVMYMKPNLAWLKIAAKGDPADATGYLCNGTSVYEYDAGRKSVTEHKIPAAPARSLEDKVKGYVPEAMTDNLFLHFLSGSMTAAGLMKRFDLRLVKEEEYYIHIELKPRLDKDRQEFDSVTLVLYGPKAAAYGWDYLPKVVIIPGSSGQSEDRWTLDKMQPNAKEVAAESFRFSRPDGWQLIPAREIELPKAGFPQTTAPTGR